MEQLGKAFVDNLSEKASVLYNNPCKDFKNKKHFISFSKTAQYPLKPWYEEIMANIFNKLVDNDKIVEFIYSYYRPLHHGKSQTGLTEIVDFGPDRICAVGLWFISNDNKEELSKFLNIQSEDAFLEEGEVGNSYWASLSSVEKTLFNENIKGEMRK